MEVRPLNGYLIYHPKRAVTNLDGLTIYHDSISGNQDPYIWNTHFLHSFCHITQMSPEVGEGNFWVSGDRWPDFTRLYCDLVFVVWAKVYWSDPNNIASDDPLVDSRAAYADHYGWAHQHPLRRRRRYTLKADPLGSFQPQDTAGNLLDLVPFLAENGFSVETLRQGLRSGFSSRPFWIGSLSGDLHTWLAKVASRKLTGTQLQEVRQQHPELASSYPKGAEDIPEVMGGTRSSGHCS